MSIVTTAVEDVAESAAKTAVGSAATTSLLPWILLAALTVFIGAIGASFFYGKHVEELVFNAFVSAEAAKAQAQVASNKSALLKQAAVNQAAIDSINQTHAEDTSENLKRRDALLTANRNLTQRLYVATASSGSGGAVVPASGTSGPVDNATGYAALSIGSSNFFIDEFSEADQLAIDLTAAQKLIIQDRLMCNGSLPGITSAAGATQ